MILLKPLGLINPSPFDGEGDLVGDDKLLDKENSILHPSKALSTKINTIVDFGEDFFYILTKVEEVSYICALQATKTNEQFQIVWKTKLQKPSFALFEDRYNVYGCTFHVDKDGNLFVGYGNFFYSFIAKSGILRWRIERNDTFESMILFGDNHYIVSWKNTIVAYSKNGAEVWEKRVEGEGSRFKVISCMIIAGGILFVHNTITLFALNPYSNSDQILWKLPTHDFHLTCAACTRAAMLYSPTHKTLHISVRGKLSTIYVGDGKKLSDVKVMRECLLYEGIVGGLYPKLLRIKPSTESDFEFILSFADQIIYCHDQDSKEFMWKKGVHSSAPPYMYNVLYEPSDYLIIVGFQGGINFTNLKTRATHHITLKEEKSLIPSEWSLVKNGYVSLMISHGKMIAACEGWLYIIEYLDHIPFILSKWNFSEVFGPSMIAFPYRELPDTISWSQENQFFIQ